MVQLSITEAIQVDNIDNLVHVQLPCHVFILEIH